MNAVYDSRWLWFPAPRPAARFRLICLPYAGGSAAVFKQWPESLPDVEVAVVRFPGRERRYAEAPFRKFDDLLAALSEAVEPLRDRPLALFGHSLGGMVAFELARHMSADSRHVLAALLVSGCRAPGHVFSDPTSHLSNAAFADHLRTFGLVPDVQSLSAELVDLMLPTVRADFEVAETYIYRPGHPLHCPIHGFCGTRDTHVTVETMASWRQQTTGEFVLDLFTGDHFFFMTEHVRLMMTVRAFLGSLAI